ncbi:lysophospholipase [Maribacter sp.]|nr:lysophospholipase [Maribacter sp.]
MTTTDFTFRIHKTEIYCKNIVPNTTRGFVVLVHGFGEHSGRYEESVIPMLNKIGMAVVTYDNIGHGKSAGKRGHCPSYMALLDVLASVIEKAKALYPEKPFFLYGHSMGGNLVLNYALRRKDGFMGIVATSPYLRLAFQPPKWKMLLGKLMLRIMPSITLPSGLDPNGISRISEEVTKYKNDPLIFDAVSPMYSFPVIEAGEWAIANAGQLSSRALLLHGTGDQIIDYHGTEGFHKNSNKTTLRLFEEGYHELHNDLCSKEVLSTISAWLQSGL